jgi:Lon protease-like protein
MPDLRAGIERHSWPGAMMEDQTDPPGSEMHCRLFPLPNVVLFPHAILPLHIFEPRYRQMTEDALADDRRVTIIQIRPMANGTPWTEPDPIVDVGCLGRIVEHKRLPDGRFHLLLLGTKRVRILRELVSPKPYRIAKATFLEDREDAEGSDSRRNDLLELFLEVFQQTHDLDPDLARMLHSNLPMGVLSDIIAHALDLSASEKQSLLNEPRVYQRVEILLGILGKSFSPPLPSRRFPPPFSPN